jgi:short-subunit dehydrogenase
MATVAYPGSSRPLAIVTGALSGMGYYLAKECAQHDFDLLIVGGDQEAAGDLRYLDVNVITIEADLATTDGVERLLAAAEGRAIECLLADVSRGLGTAFLNQDFVKVCQVIDGSVYLIQKIGRKMRERDQGRILISGSIARFMPGTYQALYNGTKAFLNSFSFPLRAELKGTRVTVTCLMPPASENEFFERCNMREIMVDAEKTEDDAEVARTCFRAMLEGKVDVVAGQLTDLSCATLRQAPQSY